MIVIIKIRTPLHLACYFGSIDAARFLIESGANVNALASDDVRPLAFAIMKNHIEIVRYCDCSHFTGENPFD